MKTDTTGAPRPKMQVKDLPPKHAHIVAGSEPHCYLAYKLSRTFVSG